MYHFHFHYKPSISNHQSSVISHHSSLSIINNHLHQLSFQMWSLLSSSPFIITIHLQSLQTVNWHHVIIINIIISDKATRVIFCVFMEGFCICITIYLCYVKSEVYSSLAFDVSADLTELGKTPVVVVCAGIKSILDIKLTLEFLVSFANSKME